MLPTLLTALFASPAAHASGFYFVDTGTRGASRAGAFVASVDDLSAQHYNNAGLVRLDGPQVTVNLSGFVQQVEFTRKDYDSTGALVETYPTVENEGPPLVIPGFGVAHDFGLPNTVFALGMWAPNAPDMLYPRDGAQRYTLVDSLVWQIYGGPSVAHRFNDKIAVGAGFIWTLVRAEQELFITTCGTAGEEDSTCAESSSQDIAISMAAWDTASFTGSLGVLVTPVHWLDIGASVLPPIPVQGKGTLGAAFSEDHTLAAFLEDDTPDDGYISYQDDDITLLLTMPLVARLGVAVHPSDALDVEVAGVFQGWRSIQEIRVTDVDLVMTVPEDGLVEEDVVITDDVVLPAGYRDTWSVRVGAGYDLNPAFHVRGGAYYETSAVPPRTQGVDVVDGNKWGVALGGTWSLRDWLDVDLGASQAFIAPREIKNSAVTQVAIPLSLADLTSAEVTEGKVVGNGDFKSSVTIVTLGVTAKWGRSGDTATAPAAPM